MRIHYAVLLTAAALLPLIAQTPKSNTAADWPMYNRDLAGTRYSPLTQINTANVSNVKLAWTYRLSNAPAGRGAAPARHPQRPDEQNSQRNSRQPRDAEVAAAVAAAARLRFRL